mmetsp:Transcript_33365/g.61196  ORF Transcript_33365/g.61196 Transcript_33365/m.61196 type:complete len:382 (-) Transcript_33365:77-1222(-)
MALLGKARYSPYDSGYGGTNGSVAGAAEELTTIWVGDLPQEVTYTDLYIGFGPFGAILGANVSPHAAASGMRSGFVRFRSRNEAEMAIASAQLGQALIWGQPVVCQWAKSNSFASTPAEGGKGGSPGYGAWKGRAGPASHAPAAFSHIYGAALYPPQRYLGGKPYTQAQPQAEPITTLWVGSLPEGVLDADLAEAFSICGQVIVATVHRKPSPQGSYSGFVRFTSRVEAEAAMVGLAAGAITVHGQAIVGQWAKVNSRVDGMNDAGLGPNGYAKQEPIGARPAAAQVTPVAVPGVGVRTLFMGNLPSDVTEAEISQGMLEMALEGAVKICPSKLPGRGPTAFVRFLSAESACEALDVLRGSPLDIRGSLVEVQFARNDTFS